MEEIILNNLGLVNKAIKDLHCRYKNQDEYEELYQIGIIGLIRSAKKYDSAKGKSGYLYKGICYELKKSFYLNSMGKRYINLNAISLDQVVYTTDDEVSLIDIIPSNEDIEKDFIKEETKERVVNTINKLQNERYKTFICEYYGINQPKLNYTEIAKKYGVTRQYVQQCFKSGEKKLKILLEKEFKDEKDDFKN